MGLLRLTNGYDRKRDAKLLETASFIHQQMNGNRNFPTPTPTMAEFGATTDAYQKAVTAATKGDRVLMSLKRKERQTVVDALHLLGFYVLYAAGGDRIKAISSGMALVKDKSTVVLEQPMHVTVTNSSQTGVLLISTQKATGAVSYVINYTSDPEMKKEGWRTILSSTIKCKLEGLQPGTVYYIRVGAVGRKNQVLYSDVVSRMAV